MSAQALTSTARALPATDELRKPALLVAFGLVVVCVALELGAAAFLHGAGNVASTTAQITQTKAFQDLTGAQARTLQSVMQSAAQGHPPGIAIGYLALVHGILAYTLGLMALSLVAPVHLQAKAQGIVSLIGGIVLLIVSLILALVALFKLVLMVTLFFSAPFGTIAYLVVWGAFPKAQAAVILSLIMALLVGASVALVVAQQRFLRDKGLIMLILTAFLATIIVSFLHGLVPFPLVSITDALAAVVVAVIAAIWALVIAIGSIYAVVSAATTA